MLFVKKEFEKEFKMKKDELVLTKEKQTVLLLSVFKKDIVFKKSVPKLVVSIKEENYGDLTSELGETCSECPTKDVDSVDGEVRSKRKRGC